MSGNKVRFDYEVQEANHDSDRLVATDPAIRWNGGVVTRAEVHAKAAMAVRARVFNTYLHNDATGAYRFKLSERALVWLSLVTVGIIDSTTPNGMGHTTWTHPRSALGERNFAPDGGRHGILAVICHRRGQPTGLADRRLEVDAQGNIDRTGAGSPRLFPYHSYETLLVPVWRRSE